MDKRNRFSRNCLASSRGSYVRKSHLLFVQENLAKRGITASIKDIIEVTITISVKPRYSAKCFGKTIRLSEHEAKKLSPQLVIKL